MQDYQFRDQFDEWTEPLRATPPPAVAALRSRIRRRTARTAAAMGSALAVVGLAAGLLVANGLVSSRKPGGPALQAPGAAYPAPPGQPYVFVNSSATFVNAGGIPATPAELRNAATGKVVKVLRPVGRGVSFSAAAAAPGDRLFVLAQQDSDETLSFAEIRIGASGKPGALRQVLPDLPMPGMEVVSMAVNAPGTRLSFTTAASNLSGASGPSGSLVVYNLLTGTRIGSWPVAFDSSASSQFLGYGNNLVASIGTVEHGRELLLDATTPFRPASSLLADSRPYGVGGSSETFTQDGNIGMEWVNTLLVEVSVASGKAVRNIPIGPSGPAGPYFCGVLWASANGHELWTQCGTRQLAIVGGRATEIRLAWLLPTNTSSGASEFAW